MPILIEACCGCAADVIEAEKGGADRAELNTALELGGLTPSVGALCAAKEHARIPIFVMLRPRAGGFCYDRIDLDTMASDAKALLNAGADGLVVGALKADGTVDYAACARLLETANNAGKPAVFHRAIDVVPCWQRAFETLMELGFARVLTSGQARTAPDGADTIAQMVRFAAEHLQVLPGGGVRLENAAQLLRRTGCGQIHLSCRTSLFDQTMPADGPVRFNADSLPPENVFKRTDRAYFAALKQALSVNCPPGAGCAGQDT